MATQTQQKLRVAYTRSGKSPEIRTGIESQLQTYKAGTVLFMTSTGTLRGITAHTNPANIGIGIAGVAIKDAGNVANLTTEIPYIVANDDTVFLANVGSTTSAATATVSVIKLGDACGGSANSSRFYVDVTAGASASLVKIIAKFEDDAFGDKYGRVYFQFLKAQSVFGTK